MKLYWDNKSTIDIAHNPMQHDCTKHVEVDKHFGKAKLNSWLICTPFESTEGQLVDVLTKGWSGTAFQSIIRKLGMYNIYSPTWGGVLEIITIVICSCRRYIAVIYNCVSCTTIYIYMYIYNCVHIYIYNPWFVRTLPCSFFSIVIYIYFIGCIFSRYE